MEDVRIRWGDHKVVISGCTTLDEGESREDSLHSSFLGEGPVSPTVTCISSGFSPFPSPLQVLNAVHLCLQGWLSDGRERALLGQWSGDFPSSGVELSEPRSSSASSQQERSTASARHLVPPTPAGPEADHGLWAGRRQSRAARWRWHYVSRKQPVSEGSASPPPPHVPARFTAAISALITCRLSPAEPFGGAGGGHLCCENEALFHRLPVSPLPESLGSGTAGAWLFWAWCHQLGRLQILGWPFR